VVIVTGDIANEGHPEEYEMAGAALAELAVPVYCLAGNHDRADVLNAQRRDDHARTVVAASFPNGSLNIWPAT
jgi:3',5'-cyclic AMP phosphodiesterase CpdA